MSSSSSSTKDLVPFSGTPRTGNSTSRGSNRGGPAAGQGKDALRRGGGRAGAGAGATARMGPRGGGSVKTTKKKTRKKQKEFHTLEKPQYPHPARGRTVFTSIATLQRDWKQLPIDLLADCILFLDCDRAWVFHGIQGELPYAFFKTGFDARFGSKNNCSLLVLRLVAVVNGLSWLLLAN